ncbi:MAG: HYExAFE family protein [Pirellulales bacterium]|nr:HYExAFE family protein [Pirellulales bacterium]
MTKRSNHYEVAFEEYLRGRAAPYVAVDEQRRSLVGRESLKSLDFIVSSPRAAHAPGAAGNWLIDVKGRQFPSGRQKRYWKNWSTRDEVDSLAQWETAFGASFAALILFAYEVVGDVAPLPAEQLFACRGRLYAFVGVRLHEYVHFARQISPKWDTLAVPTATFRRLAEPVDRLI